jgi:hypothetical protein
VHCGLRQSLPVGLGCVLLRFLERVPPEDCHEYQRIHQRPAVLNKCAVRPYALPGLARSRSSSSVRRRRGWRVCAIEGCRPEAERTQVDAADAVLSNRDRVRPE